MKEKLVLAYSGGLDTSYCVSHLTHEKGFEVHAVCVNTGGFTAPEVEEMERKARALGAAEFLCIDAIENFYQKIVRYLIFGNVLRNNTYPLSVSAERIVQALAIVDYARNIQAAHIAHGSTGAGNDQVRFDLIFQTLAPGIRIITPIRDQGLSREEEIEYLKSRGFEARWEKARYSVNKGLWGTSVGGEETLKSRHPLPDHAYPSPLTGHEPKPLQLDFTHGEPSGVNGESLSPVACIERIRELASPFAIGRDIHVGDTVIGIKGRVGFEAPAALILIKAHELLEKHTLSKWQKFQKEGIADFYGMLLHEGQYLDEVMRNSEAYLEDSQKYVSGRVYLTLHPYRFTLDGIESPHDLMDSGMGAYGEENLGWTSEEARGFIKITANPLKIAQLKNKHS